VPGVTIVMCNFICNISISVSIDTIPTVLRDSAHKADLELVQLEQDLKATASTDAPTNICLHLAVLALAEKKHGKRLHEHTVVVFGSSVAECAALCNQWIR
jgi:hypothetical protein